MLCVLELLFMKDLVLLRLKKIILMILLQAVMMLMKVAFRKDTGLADVNAMKTILKILLTIRSGNKKRKRQFQLKSSQG